MNKEKYIEYAKETFIGKTLDIVLNQIELFYKGNANIKKNKYSIGDDVFLKKGTFLHGLGNNNNNIDFILNNGFIACEFNGDAKAKKYFNNIGVWNIRQDIFLKDYINLYSGVTLTRNINGVRDYKLIPHDEIMKMVDELNNDKNVRIWNMQQTKEIKFLPSLHSGLSDYCLILNMESNYAKELSEADIFNPKMDKEILVNFIAEPFVDEFINEPHNALTTDRESGIMFGLPVSLVEGILVSRKVENDEESLDYIKSKFPNCYICNLDGKVIVANK